MGRRPRLTRGKDYEIVDGQLQFTREYLIGLGGCCRQDCKNCPYANEKAEREAAKKASAASVALVAPIQA